MIIFPAIDIQEGKVVRLRQGKFDQMTEYSANPVTMAKRWEAAGAQWLHVVDLDGAKTGQMRNQDIVLEIVRSIAIPVQAGGGIRDQAQIERLLNGGLARVILGTKVIEDRTFLKAMIKRWGGQIAVSLDCHDGVIAQHGWTTTSNMKAVDLVKELESLGVGCLIYTDIARDGMLNGPNLKSLTALAAATTIPIIASGGISNIEDIKQLAAMRDQGICGAITGKALYEGKLDLNEAIQAASQ